MTSGCGAWTRSCAVRWSWAAMPTPSRAHPYDDATAMTAPAPRREILEIHPYVAGESDIPGINRILKLSSNEGAFGVPPSAKKAIIEVTDEVFRYPDGSAKHLRAAIGKRWGLNPERIVCGAGSDDLLYQLALSYGGPDREIIMSAHGFSIYN